MLCCFLSAFDSKLYLGVIFQLSSCTVYSWVPIPVHRMGVQQLVKKQHFDLILATVNLIWQWQDKIFGCLVCVYNGRVALQAFRKRFVNGDYTMQKSNCMMSAKK